MRSKKVDYVSNSHVATLDKATTCPASTTNNAAAGLVKEGIAAAQKGDRDAARKFLTQAAEADPRSEDAWMWLASISEYPEELLSFLQNVLEINPENKRAQDWHAATRSLLAKTLVQRGCGAHDEGNVDLANSCFDQALEHDNECVLAWLWKAQVTESDEQKVAYLERVLEIEPDHEEARQALARFREPSPDARFEEAKWAAVAGRRSEAMHLLDEVLEKAPDNFEAWIFKSHFSLDITDKLSALEKALEIDPDNYAARAGYDFLKATVNGAQAAIDQPLEENFTDQIVRLGKEPAEDTSAQTAAMHENPGSLGPVDAASPFAEIAIEPVPEERLTENPLQSESAKQTFLSTVQEADPLAVTVEEAMFTAFTEPVEGIPVDEAVVENNSVTAEPASEFVTELPMEEYFEEGAEYREQAEVEYGDEPLVVDTLDAECAFCQALVNSQAFDCGECHAVLTLSDLELLLANTKVDRAVIRQSVTKMEADWNLREFSVHELTVLGIGHFNLRNFDQGFKYLQEAARLDPNNVILSGQVNALAIRLDEIRRQDEIDGSKPKGKSILVVDDSATVRKLISAKLEKSGHNVTCAVDGLDGLEKLSDSMPDLVLLDIAMPRMDGYEVCKQIRANPNASDVPIVMISGKDGFFDKVRGKMAGCTGYVTKPFGPETLMKALETYLLPENGHAE